ncbi:MAG: PEP-CTERM sorting domain-containing protein [Planctomycetaceae bacterium]
MLRHDRLAKERTFMMRMFLTKRLGWGGLLLGGFLLLPGNTADAAAVIFNTGSSATASIALGVNDEGHLNVADPDTSTASSSGTGEVGLAFKFLDDGLFYDATSPGCLCEGWGVSATYTGDASAHSGYANVSTDGVVNLTLDSFATDAAAGTGSFATSSVHLGSLTGLKVTQSYAVATNTSDLFKNTVTITNDTDSTLNDVRYVRVMDWDVPHTEFDEFVTINGTGTTTLLEESDNNGFSSADPLAAVTSFGQNNVDFFDVGPDDHGAYFRFNFGSLAAGDSYTFDIFYGAAATETLANAAIVAESIELYSLGQSTTVAGGPANFAPTFVFGFKGVGGIIIDPPPVVPEPSTMALALLGLGGLAAVARRRRNRK